MSTSEQAAATRPPSAPGDRKRGPFKLQRYGGWLLYFWHGMRFGAWLRLLARGRFDVTLNCLPNIATVTLWTPVNSALYVLSEAIYGRRADRVRLADEEPLFVLGHWRTGTTLLHDLLACDPAFAFPTTYQCFFPNHFLLTERALARPMRVFLPRKRPQDDVPVGFERPQEEEFAFSILGMGTPYNTMAWPRHGPADGAYLDPRDLGPEARRRWLDGAAWFYRRLALRHRRPAILKSPAHTARVELLRELFPKARFVHIARDPRAVVPSTVRLWKTLYSTQGLHNPPSIDGWIEEHVLDTFVRLEERYAADRAAIPAGRLAEIRYEALAADPKATLRDIYARLGLGDFARAEAAVDAYLADRRAHKPATYELDAERRRRVETRLGAYMRRFGYAAETGAPPA